MAAWVCGRLCARAPPHTHTPHAPSPDPVSPPFARRCDCGPQLEAALQAVEADGYGVVLYLRGQEGRGIGLGAKMHAYALQERGADTLDANTQLGLPVDSREYGTGAQILVSLGIRDMRLMSNNPKKFSGLAGYGLRITERVASKTIPNPNNIQYPTCARRWSGWATCSTRPSSRAATITARASTVATSTSASEPCEVRGIAWQLLRIARTSPTGSQQSVPRRATAWVGEPFTISWTLMGTVRVWLKWWARVALYTFG